MRVKEGEEEREEERGRESKKGRFNNIHNLQSTISSYS